MFCIVLYFDIILHHQTNKKHKKMKSKYEELLKLNNLYKEGIISEEEYQSEKSKLLENTETVELEKNQDDQKGYNTFMHLSQFTNYVLPTLGVIIPIIMWATRKNESKSVDLNGKIILNWRISSILYTVIAVFIFIIAGSISVFSFIPWEVSDAGMNGEVPFGPLAGLFSSIAALILPILFIGVLDFIFTIIGAIKASNDEVWNYPLSIKFFKTT